MSDFLDGMPTYDKGPLDDQTAESTARVLSAFYQGDADSLASIPPELREVALAVGSKMDIFFRRTNTEAPNQKPQEILIKKP